MPRIPIKGTPFSFVDGVLVPNTQAKLPSALTTTQGPLTGLDAWLAKLFPCELFDGGGRCLWLRRWILAQWWGYALYLHHWLHDDWTTHHHDHSRWMLSIGLSGRYTEHFLTKPDKSWRAPWIRWFPATHCHYITLDTPQVWTLVFTGRKAHGSAFYVNGERWGSDYLTSSYADQQKRC